MHRLPADVAGLTMRPLRCVARPPQLSCATIECVAIRVRGALGGARELEEVPMPIVGGLDIHRKQRRSRGGRAVRSR